MSHDFAVWVGVRPANEVAATAEFEARFERYERDDTPPDPAIRAFVRALTEAYPETGLNGTWIWALTPLLGETGGNFLYLNMTRSEHLDAVLDLASRLAKEHGLVAYDPQLEETF